MDFYLPKSMENSLPLTCTKINIKKGGENLIITRLNIPLTVVTEGADLILLDVTEYFEYKDGKATNHRLGAKYRVGDTKHFEQFSVKVPEKDAVITRDDLKNAKDPIKVTFADAFCKPYRTDSGGYDLSITAKSISLVK